jgi:ABC-type transport system involved in multi-copper enzyme maturation permease subunit
MIPLLRAEWLKLTRRPLTWILLAVFLALLVLQMVSEFVFLNLVLGSLRSSQAGLAAQVEEWRRRTAFPGVFGAVLGHINGLGGIFAVILTAGAMGSEYSWGTLRAQLARHPSRTRYLATKVIALLLLLAVAAILTLLVGAALGAALGAISGRIGAVAPSDIGRLPLAILRALYVLLPYVLLTLCLTILGRSLLVGVAGGLLYLVFETVFGALALFQVLGGVWQLLYNLTVQQNINALVQLNSHAFGLQPESVAPTLAQAQLPSPFQATLVVAFYSAGFFATALYVFRRRDITGAV